MSGTEGGGTDFAESLSVFQLAMLIIFFLPTGAIVRDSSRCGNCAAGTEARFLTRCLPLKKNEGIYLVDGTIWLLRDPNANVHRDFFGSEFRKDCMCGLHNPSLARRLHSLVEDRSSFGAQATNGSGTDLQSLK